jgi:hypothetical protein
LDKEVELRTRELCSSDLVALSADLARADITAVTAAVAAAAEDNDDH